MSARTSLEERLRVLVSYLRVHDYCTSTYPSAREPRREQCHEIATYVCLLERIRLHRDNPSSRLLVKPSIHTKELTEIMEQSSRRCRKIYFPRGQTHTAVKV